MATADPAEAPPQHCDDIIGRLCKRLQLAEAMVLRRRGLRNPHDCNRGAN